jgi:hypothetical protein
MAQGKHTPGPMTFSEFLNARWGKSWGVCRATPGNRERYARCVTRTEYKQAVADYRRQHTAEALRHDVPEVGDIAADLFMALQAVLSVADRKTVEFDLARAAIATAKGE